MSLILTLLFNNVFALFVGMSIYAFGFDICNATLYRIILFSCSHGLGAIPAILGMVSVGVFSIGGSLLAIAGTGDNLSSYIIAVAIPAGFAPFLIINLLSDKKNNSVVAESANL
ncbi:hypothetical protein YM80_004849 [Salmonella enterica subsp. salamae]|nr:hypothetical protein [Salmonella enterica subsp. salamae]